MNKDRKDKGENNVEISEIEKPIIETHQQNGNSDSDEWKKVLEREKLELEIEKIRADKGKIEIETEELKKPFFRKQAFLQTALIALFTILISGLGVGWTIYNGFEQIKTGRMQADKKDLEKDYVELDKKNNEASQKNKALEDERKNLDVQINEQKTEKGRLLEEKKVIEREGNEIKREKVKIDDELKMLTAQSVVQQGLQQGRINDLQLKREKLEEKNKEIEDKKTQLERDIVTSEVKGNYLLLKAVTKLPEFYPRSGESIRMTDSRTVKSVYEESRHRFRNEPAYKQGLLSFIESKSQENAEKPTTLMFGYIVTDDAKWKNQLLELAKKQPFLSHQGNVTYMDGELFSSLLTALFEKEEDKIQLISLILDSLETFNVADRNEYLSYLHPLLITPAVDVTIPDKKVFLRLMAVARDDFIENGPGAGSEILFRRSLRAYFSVTGKILSENNDLCGERYLNTRRIPQDCKNEWVKSSILQRAAVIGLLGAHIGIPIDANPEIWQRWIETNKDVVDLWLEKDFRTFNLNDTLYKKMTEDKQGPYFKLN